MRKHKHEHKEQVATAAATAVYLAQRSVMETTLPMMLTCL